MNSIFQLDALAMCLNEVLYPVEIVDLSWLKSLRIVNNKPRILIGGDFSFDVAYSALLVGHTL